MQSTKTNVSTQKITPFQKSLLSGSVANPKKLHDSPLLVRYLRENVSAAMVEEEEPKMLRIAFITSYLPQKCGIATFAADLREAALQYRSDIIIDIVAVAEHPEEIDYPDEIVYRIEKHRWKSYSECGDYLNSKGYDLVCLQHEFGLFGGEEGSYIVDLLRQLQMPVVTTLHTLLANPTPEYYKRTCEVLQASDAVVTLTPCGLNLMHSIYHVSTSSISHVIPHGIPDIPFTMPEEHKEEFGWENRHVLMTFGLIGPSKGIELMIDALPAIVDEHPNLLYVIVGATHPGVIADQGESYRDGLKQHVARLGLQENVAFISHYIPNDELCRYLQACDVYVTPYRNRDQISSGTLAFAFGAGRALVSTPYWYAVDLLSNECGILVDFNSPDQLALAVTSLLSNEEERRMMYRRAYEHSRKMLWGIVAEEYDDLFFTLVRRSHQAVQQMVHTQSMVEIPTIYRS